MKNQHPQTAPWRIALRALTVVFCLFPVPHSAGASGINKPVYCLVAEGVITAIRTPAAPVRDWNGNVVDFEGAR